MFSRSCITKNIYFIHSSQSSTNCACDSEQVTYVISGLAKFIKLDKGYFFMIITFMEIIDIIIMTFAIGFIFSDFMGKMLYSVGIRITSFYKLILYSSFITAPGIVLHEMGHKFVALILGIPAVFHASYIWLGIGIILKFLSFPFIFFVPGYVEHGTTTPLAGSFVAFAGPFMNLLMWIVPKLFLKNRRIARNKKWHVTLTLTSRINIFLFIFNMLPIPPFDGFHVFYGLFKTLF